MNEVRDIRTGPGALAAERPTTSSEAKGTVPGPTLLPPVDVIEDAQAITLYADLPGVSRDRLQLQVESGTLTIDAELDLALPEGLQSSHSEVGLGRFHRSFTLSKELDADKVTADLTQGVLRLRIPKAEHARPRRIPINVT
ncbi:MAG: Hsp20/alpha crystallin family protein [Comamonadaceae bacterium]|nr:MAG: Hsp20/alpha crystallin family protein [Comamonadaceae bacterium]